MHKTSTLKAARNVSADTAAASEKALADLVGRVVCRDEAALGELYDATVARLFALARAIVRNSADAEEIVVDTYTQVWQTAPTFDATRGRVMAWLFTICRSRALDRLRKQRLQEGSSVELECGGPAEAPDQPMEVLLDALQQGSAIRQAVASLAPIRRQLLSLAFFEGLSHHEIAKLTTLPVGTVKSHIRRALATLRAELYEEHPDAPQSE